MKTLVKTAQVKWHSCHLKEDIISEPQHLTLRGGGKNHMTWVEVKIMWPPSVAGDHVILALQSAARWGLYSKCFTA